MDAAKSSERSAPGRVSPKTSIFWASNSCGLPGPGAPGAAGSAQRGTRSGRRNKSSAAEPGAALAGKGAGKTGPQHPPVQPQVRKSGSSAVIFRPEVVLRAPFLQRWERRGGFTLQILPQQSGGFFFRREGGRPQGPRRRRRLRAVTLCPVLAGPQKPYKWARGGTERCGTPPLPPQSGLGSRGEPPLCQPPARGQKRRGKASSRGVQDFVWEVRAARKAEHTSQPRSDGARPPQGCSQRPEQRPQILPPCSGEHTRQHGGDKCK